jgi:hypothetical protein
VTPLRGYQGNRDIGVEELMLAGLTEPEMSDEHRRVAIVVAGHAVNLDDCVELLGMLGISTGQNREIPPARTKA